MYICSVCLQNIHYPVVLDCGHMICTLCMHDKRTKYPQNNAIYKCTVCDRPVLLNSEHTVVIDKDEYPLDTSFKEP